MPNGIVMIRMNATMPARTYKIAIHQPQSTSQITFRINRIMPPQLPARIHRPHSDTPRGDGSCLRTSAYGAGTRPGLCRIRTGVVRAEPRRQRLPAPGRDDLNRAAG